MTNDAPLSTEPELLVVMPAFNERAAIRKVVTEWFQEIENWTERFTFLVIDDGSTDETVRILERLREQFGPRLEIHSRANRGHGQTCLEGYRIACERGAPFVLQIDSDGQCDPQFFFRFWLQREKCDAIFGRRTQRGDGFRRAIVSRVLRFALLLGAGVNVPDANVPYRLIRTSVLAPHLAKIPPTFDLANLALAVLLHRDRALRISSVPIHFRDRYGGEPSVRLGLFGGKAVELFRQLRQLDS